MAMISRRGALVGIGASLVVGPSAALGQQRKYTPMTDIGPFYPLVRAADEDNDLTLIGKSGRRAIGQVIEVSGRVLDIKGNPVPHARIELWQANAAGRYAHPSDDNPNPLDPDFQGFAKLTGGADGSYRYTTIKPGAYPDGDNSPRPPHVHLDVSGAKNRIVTQMIFAGDPLNDTDDVLAGFPRERLTAKALGARADGVRRFGWDVILLNG
jgi:protocatechuate 3,4-dioxygenase beta subunit